MRQALPVWRGLFFCGDAREGLSHEGAKGAPHSRVGVEGADDRWRGAGAAARIGSGHLRWPQESRSLHPVWEETIEWERLETYLQRLTGWQAQLI